MRKTATGAALAGLLMTAILGTAAGSDRGDPAEGQAVDTGRGVKIFRTHPAGEAVTREERERSYRSCLFTYLPRIGSDAAAEMIRDACREEFLGGR